MTSLFRPALVLFVVLSLVTGLAYPLAVTGLAQVLFPDQANGSLVKAKGVVVGRDYPALPILLMTGYADQRERAFGLELLIRDVIAKPFTLTAICGAVRAALAPQRLH